MSYIWATQDFKVDSNNVHKCECDQFKQLWHSRITCDAIDSNNMMYKTFKYFQKKSILKFSLSPSKKRYSNPEWGRTNCQSITVNTLMYLELIDITSANCDKSDVFMFMFLFTYWQIMPFVHIAHGGLLPHSSPEDPVIFRIYILHAFNAGQMASRGKLL